MFLRYDDDNTIIIFLMGYVYYQKIKWIEPFYIIECSDL